MYACTLVYDSKICMINKCFSNIETTSLNDRLNLAFFERRNGRFVEGIACFVKDNLSY